MEKNQCTHCDGLGHCLSCDGMGYVGRGRFECTACNGNGRCSECDGYGYVPTREKKNDGLEGLVKIALINKL